MSEFWREGHYRSRNGTTYWVEGHWVNRDDWSRFSLPPTPGIARTTPSSLYPVVKSLINPNARCPVCGDSVFYYENDAGGRVYFDTLAPDWDKHPCTDNAEWTKPNAFREAMRISAFSKIKTTPHRPASIAIGQNTIGAGWLALRVRCNEESGHPPVLIVISLANPASGRQFLKVNGPPTRLKPGRTVFWKDDTVSYFDVEAFEPVLRSASLYETRPGGALSKRQRRLRKKARNRDS